MTAVKNDGKNTAATDRLIEAFSFLPQTETLKFDVCMQK
jgi:hypothetical protein